MLLLTTPAQHATDNPSVIINTKQLKLWVQGLPKSNVLKTVRLLHQAIEPFNELQLEDGDRLKLLEVYYEAFEEILYLYDDLRLRQLAISIEERKSLAEDIMWLYFELANGYKIIVKNLSDAEHKFLKSHTILLPIYRAMELIIHALLCAYRANQSPPHLAYLEIHQLYLYAETQNHLVSKIKTQKLELPFKTIGNLYKQFVLFVIADPSTLNGGEIFEFFLLLEQFAKYADLSQQIPKDDLGKFTVDLMEDTAPCCFSDTSKQTLPETIRILDATRVVDAMKIKYQQEELANDKDGYTDEDLYLFKVLINQLSSPNCKNSEDNVVAIDEIYISIGVDAVCYLSDIEHYQQAMEETVEVHGGIEVQNLYDDVESSYKLKQWGLLNKYDGTLQFRCSHRQQFDQIVPGELIAMYDEVTTSSEVNITVAVITNVSKATDTKSLIVEASRLPDLPIPLIAEAKEKGQDSFSGLYFPKEPMNSRPAMILLQKNIVENYPSITIHLKEKCYTIRPYKLSYETPLLALFSFKIINNNEKMAASA